MSRFPSRTRTLAGCLALAILIPVASAGMPAQQPPGAKQAEAKKADPAEKTRAVIDKVLGRHEVFPDAESKAPLQVVRALRWSNNTRGTDNALTVLYVRKGRPYAAACL